MKKFSLYCIILVLFGSLFQSCGVCYTNVTASLDWCTNNGDTLGHWDNIILSTTTHDISWNGAIVGSSTETNTSIKLGGGLGFLTNEGKSEYISGGLIHLYNVGRSGLTLQQEKEIDIEKRFEFSDAIYYNYGREHLFLGNNYNEAYKTLIQMRDKGIITQEVVNVFVLLKRQFLYEKEYGTQYNTIN